MSNKRELQMSKCLKQISCPEEKARQASRAPSIDCHADIYRHIRVAAAVLAVEPQGGDV